MDEQLKHELKMFFLLFGAEHSLNATHEEKIERVLHELQPKNMKEVEKMCLFIVQKAMLESPEEEVLEALKKRFRKM